MKRNTTIQDINELKTEINDIVNDYIKGEYGDRDNLFIYMDYDGVVKVDVLHCEDKIPTYPQVDTIKLIHLIGDNNEPDADRIDDIVNQWLFLD